MWHLLELGGGQAKIRKTSKGHDIRTTFPSIALFSFFHPPLPPNPHDSLSVLQCRCKLSLLPGLRNELAHINFNVIEYHHVMFLLATFNGDVLFELPPCRGSTFGTKGMEGMDKRYDSHTWCRTSTSNIHNDVGLKFRKSYCDGHLICENTRCEHYIRSSKSNETEWIGITNHSFSLGHIPPPNSTVLCRICDQSSTCLNLCSLRIYYVLRSKDFSRACIHLGAHSHPVVDGQYKESFEAITGLISHEVA